MSKENLKISCSKRKCILIVTKIKTDITWCHSIRQKYIREGPSATVVIPNGICIWNYSKSYLKAEAENVFR